MSKKWIIGILLGAFLGVAGCAGLIALFCGGILAVTQPAVTASDEFLSLCGQGKVTEAYQSTSDSLQAAQDEKSFAFQVRQLALDQYESSLWLSRSVVNNEGKVEGQFKGKNGLYYDATIHVVKENNKWKVSKVRVETFEMPNYKFPSVPDEADLRKLAKETLLQFDKAIKADDFRLFYDTIADVWKRETTSEKLHAGFIQFFEKRVDFSSVGELTPAFEPKPTVDEDGALVLSGKYAKGAGGLKFKLKYILEGGVWKLIGMDLKTGIE